MKILYFNSKNPANSKDSYPRLIIPNKNKSTFLFSFSVFNPLFFVLLPSNLHPRIHQTFTRAETPQPTIANATRKIIAFLFTVLCNLSILKVYASSIISTIYVCFLPNNQINLNGLYCIVPII